MQSNVRSSDFEVNDSSSTDDDEDPLHVNRCDHTVQSPQEQFSTYVTMVVVFILLWQSIFTIANVAVDLLLKFLRLILLKGPFILKEQIASECFPLSLSKAQEMFKKNRDDFQKLVSCRKC